MIRKLTHFAAPLLAGFVLTALLSCKAETPRAEAPPPQPVAAVPSVPPVPVSPTVQRAFDESLLTGREFLLQKLPVVPPVVEDFDLGRLEAPEGEAGRTARDFVSALNTVVTPAPANSLRWDSYVKSRVAQLKEQGWGEGRVRWAPVQSPEEGGVLYTLLLRKEQRLAKLYLYLEREADQWRVSDAQLLELEAARPLDLAGRAPSLLP